MAMISIFLQILRFTGQNRQIDEFQELFKKLLEITQETFTISHSIHKAFIVIAAKLLDLKF